MTWKYELLSVITFLKLAFYIYQSSFTEFMVKQLHH